MAFEDICGNTNKTYSRSRQSGAPAFERCLKEYSSNVDNPYCMSAPPLKNPMDRSSGNVFFVGSGSIYTSGVLGSAYKWDLVDEEAFELGRRAIYHATYRDSYSGGIVRVYDMTANGYQAENEAAEEVA